MPERSFLPGQETADTRWLFLRQEKFSSFSKLCDGSRNDGAKANGQKDCNGAAAAAGAAVHRHEKNERKERREREREKEKDEELAGFIGLGLINSYGEVNINLDSNSVTREQSRSLPIAPTFFPIGSLPLSVPSLLCSKETGTELVVDVLSLRFLPLDL